MDGTGVDLLDQRGLTCLAAGCRSRGRSSAWWFERVSPSLTSARWMRCERHSSPRNPSPIRTVSSGTYLSTIGFKKLGVADEIVSKTRKVRGPPLGGTRGCSRCSRRGGGRFQQVSDLIHVPGVDFVSTVPSDIQPPTVFVGALPKGSQQPDVNGRATSFLCHPQKRQASSRKLA